VAGISSEAKAPDAASQLIELLLSPTADQTGDSYNQINH
jgi:hypothetical protein